MILKELFSPFNSNYQKLVSGKNEGQNSPTMVLFCDSLTPLSLRYPQTYFRWMSSSKRKHVLISSEA